MNGELVKSDDGRDMLFGDNGNDWIVGGTNCDWLFGGFGDDLLNLDDNLTTDGGLNDNPEDADPRFRDGDFAFGGAGRDVMIANTALDRMYDWGGEFNSYVVPFASFGNPMVNREFSPFAQALITAMSFGAGQDTQLAAFSPFDETALVTPDDGQLWLDQHGGPRDPQPGNIGGVNETTPAPATSLAAARSRRRSTSRSSSGRLTARSRASRQRQARSASSSRPASASGGRTRSRTSRRTPTRSWTRGS